VLVLVQRHLGLFGLHVEKLPALLGLELIVQHLGELHTALTTSQVREINASAEESTLIVFLLLLELLQDQLLLLLTLILHELRREDLLNLHPDEGIRDVHTIQVEYQDVVTIENEPIGTISLKPQIHLLTLFLEHFPYHPVDVVRAGEYDIVDDVVLGLRQLREELYVRLR
jgi:hypothetical protein